MNLGHELGFGKTSELGFGELDRPATTCHNTQYRAKKLTKQNVVVYCYLSSVSLYSVAFVSSFYKNAKLMLKA